MWPAFARRQVSISAKTEYACIAVLELSVQYECGQPVQIRKIADRHGIPSRFLVQILLQLKAAGLVASTRGACGGYRLQRTPQEITLGQVMDVIDGRERGSTTNLSVPTSESRVLWSTWDQIDAARREILDGTTFADLASSVRDPADMFYI